MSTTKFPPVRPNIPEDKLILYVVKSTPTSGANVVKVLALILALGIPHAIHVVDSPKNDEWFHEVNPLKMVPALEETDTQNGKRLNVWESSACLDYIAKTYDSRGEYGGRDTWEQTQVRNWLTMHTSGLGATAKFWLSYKWLPEPETRTLDFFKASIESQYAVLNHRLSEPEQSFIALPDRPSVADLANIPFANEEVANMAGINFAQWPALKKWSEKMLGLTAMREAIERVKEF